jgi:hypothetical protein
LEICRTTSRIIRWRYPFLPIPGGSDIAGAAIDPDILFAEQTPSPGIGLSRPW